ncbi:MAG TPA: xanthine dehydrogenase family protein molybdopterin-binding subunit [Streptosporangiaceae bacterium]|nr:xanthine dehydrogenase family protein molybdopterin-binding subunit [Streptosporangiaceae bacterium]
MSIMGTRVIRTEDPRLLTKGGVYVDDLRTPELDQAARLTFVRSPFAHARIKGIDASEALSAPGVVAVLTVRDMDDLGPPPPPGDEGSEAAPMPLGGAWAEPLLAVDTVRFVGEPVAVVITDGHYQGEEAADLVNVDYDPLPAVVGLGSALTDETLLFPDAATNVALTNPVPTDDTAFDACEVIVERDIVNQRVACVPMEGRATAAVYSDGKLTVWLSSQNAQISRFILAGALGMPPDQIRVIVPDVGGGFGAKVGIDRDGLIVAWAARKTGRALRWTETRSENLVGMTQGRAQLQHIKIGGNRDGRILAYRLEAIQDTGAYPRMSGFLPFMTFLMAPGVYDIPEVQAGYRVVVTNATPISAYRGAGRPEATAAIERAVDLFAAEIGMDPAEVRRRNFVAPDRFPFQTKTGAMYDTGRYEEALDKALAAAGYDELRQEQERRRAAGGVTQLGIGVSAYVEITAGDGGDETAKLIVNDDGSATVYTGSSPHGQGHATAWAMLVQDELGIPMDQVTVLHGDTDLIPIAVGTFASRSLQLGGSAVHKAAIEVKDEARHGAAEMLEAAEADVVLDTSTGVWQVRGDPDTALSWGQVAGHASGGSLVADVSFRQDRPTFPFGAHVSVVEVDTETGQVRMLRHVTVDDAGRVLNPVLTEGQRHGGIAQGAAQALLEEVLYDVDGNPQTSTLADYAAISAPDLPSFELVDSQTPTTLNPLGAKGIGEAGTIGSTPAIQNAVIDAVSHLGIRHIDMPATPQRVWMAINAAQKARAEKGSDQ